MEVLTTALARKKSKCHKMLILVWLTPPRYSAVVRGANAYVPPGARKNATSGTATPSSQPTPGPAPVAPKPASEEAAPSAPAPGTVAGSTPAPAKVCIECLCGLSPELTSVQPADSLVGSFRDFVTNEKQRLTQRKQALAKSEMDKRKADLLKFSKTFKVSSLFDCIDP
jgi:hypothetical protein